VEDIDFRHPRGLDRPLMRSLITSQWVAQHLAALFTGPTGIGKSWLAQALAQKACRDGYTVLYRPAPKLFRDLLIARADGSLGRVLEGIARTDVLVVDSGRWRSGFRNDVDQDYEVMPITIPTRCRSQIATASEW